MLMLKSVLHCLILSGSIFVAIHACQQPPLSNPLVTNGKEETGFPYVVQISIDQGSLCTGSFISNSLLLTAAHCVDDAQQVSYLNQKVGSNQIYIHPNWSTLAKSQGRQEPKSDVALIQFPDNTFVSDEYASIADKPIEVGDQFTIVGYGHNEISPFPKYCRVSSSVNQSNRCEVAQGINRGGATYQYKNVFEFDPLIIPLHDEEVKLECSITVLKDALKIENRDYQGFADTHCAGNLRDRSYAESGIGTKRSGSNTVADISNSMIIFYGQLSGSGTGEHAASGAGDSGGPLLISQTDSDNPSKSVWNIAGITHGGLIVDKEQQVRKKSMYVDLTAEAVSTWFKAITVEKNLAFPQYQ